MKLSTKTTLITGILVGSLVASTGALAGIKNTKHNLGSTGTGANNMDGTTEICVFCHTPHGSDNAAAVPLWNRDLGSQTYKTYAQLGTSTLDGGTAPVGSVSIACLSCHDGSQAMDVMINKPGSGGYTANTGSTLAGTWTGSNQLNGATITNIGTDLTNDHPVGIQYAGGTYGTNSTSDADFVAASTDTINGSPVWWVDGTTPGGGTRDKTDMQLYTRTVANFSNGASPTETFNQTNTGSAAEPFVECASCHDPHTENTTFLRILNDNSDVCLACHVK
jgi:predicted CXXCH cytochrome family protein